MSTDARLERLGLSHLKDKPEELLKIFDKKIKEHEEEIEMYEKECEKIKKKIIKKKV